METAVVTNFPPNVAPEMLRTDFWLQRVPDADQVWLSPDSIAAFNAGVPERTGIPAVLDLPDVLSVGEVRAAIAQYARPQKTRYGADGQPLGDAVFEALLANATPDLPERVPVKFGLCARRADLRTFPTDSLMTSRPFDFAFDRLQETTVDIGWPVALVATSRDGQWGFALTPQYWGWLRLDVIAAVSRQDVIDYVNAPDFVVTVGNRGLVALEEGGGITPQMGTRLQLREETEHAYRVGVSRRDAAGVLRLADGWIAKDSGDFARGFLPLTVRSLFEQAFKLLGERYSWGGSRLGIFGRDCSRLVRDVYATTGLFLPRNGDQQAQVCKPQVTFTPEMTAEDRTQAIVDRVSPGAILELPGHVMLYLGAVDGVPYALHDTSSSGYDGVIVSDLSLGASGPSGSLLERLNVAVTVV